MVTEVRGIIISILFSSFFSSFINTRDFSFKNSCPFSYFLKVLAAGYALCPPWYFADLCSSIVFPLIFKEQFSHNSIKIVDLLEKHSVQRFGFRWILICFLYTGFNSASLRKLMGV